MDLGELQDTLYRLAENVIRLTTQVASLRAVDEGEYHSYVGDAGAAVRARFFVSSIDSDRRWLDALDEKIANLEVLISVMTDIWRHTKCRWGSWQRKLRNRMMLRRVSRLNSMLRSIERRPRQNVKEKTRR